MRFFPLAMTLTFGLMNVSCSSNSTTQFQSTNSEGDPIVPGEPTDLKPSDNPIAPASQENPATRVEGLSVKGCSFDPSKLCLLFNSVTESKEISFGIRSDAVIQNFGRMGDHFGAELGEAYAYFSDSTNRTAVYIFNLDTEKVIGYVTAPEGWNTNSIWFGLLHGPNGRKFPFIAPGGYYENPFKVSDSRVFWNFLCQFDPAKIPDSSKGQGVDPVCGTGFRSSSIELTASDLSRGNFSFPMNTYRHMGGFLYDSDGDGFDDIHVPYLWLIKTISGRTGRNLNTLFFDSAKQTEPNSPIGFHSGRNYGGFTTFRGADGRINTLEIAGNAVGTFEDYYCNVSRFIALMQQDTSNPTSQRLVWSNYISFIKTIFSSPLTSPTHVDRPGDLMNKCVHRFGDSLGYAGSDPVVIYSFFTAEPLANSCLLEEFNIFTSQFSEAAVANYDSCAKSNYIAGKGFWSVQILKAMNGAGVNRAANVYVWGKSDKILPSHETVYLFESFPEGTKIRFDRKDRVVGNLSFFTLKSDFTFGRPVDLSINPNFPVQANSYLPVIQSTGTPFQPTEGNLGATWGGTPELSLSDFDHDGLSEIELQNGNSKILVGFDAQTRTLKVKN